MTKEEAQKICEQFDKTVQAFLLQVDELKQLIVLSVDDNVNNTAQDNRALQVLRTR